MQYRQAIDLGYAQYCLWTCIKRHVEPDVCCVRLDDWSYECSVSACTTTPPAPPLPGPPSPPGGSGSGAPFSCPSDATSCSSGESWSCPDLCADGDCACGPNDGVLCNDGVCTGTGLPAGGGPPPDNHDPPGCSLPYDDPEYGAPHPDVAQQAAPDFDCAPLGPQGEVRCQLNPALQTTIAGGQKVFAADLTAARRAFISDPTAPPSAGKSPAQVLMGPPGCGGLDEDESLYVGDGVDVAQGALVHRSACHTVGAGGQMPLQVGLRYESGAFTKQEGLGCVAGGAPEQYTGNGNFDYSGYRTNNLSNGWTISYSRRLLRAPSADEYRVYFENQRVYQFRPVQSDTGETLTAPNLYHQVGLDGVPLRSADAAVLFVPPGGIGELRYTDGTIDYFDARTGAFFQEKDRWGNHLFVTHEVREIAGRKRLVKHVGRFAPDGAGGYTEVDWLEYIHDWVWSTWRGAGPGGNVAERFYRLVGVRDSRGNTLLSLQYDEQYRVGRLTDYYATSAGRVSSYTYLEGDRLAGVRDAFGALVSTSYDLAPAPAPFAAPGVPPPASPSGAVLPRTRLLLKQHLLDGVSVARLASLHQVHAATVSRWLEDARAELLVDTRRRIVATLQLDGAEIDRLMSLWQSQLDVSVRRLLEP